MDNKEFDKYIREKLQEEIGGANADWDVMHQLLVEEDLIQEPPDEAFDQNVKDQVANARAPFDDSHWAILHEKLVTEKYLKKRLAIAKAVELSLVVLLFSTTVTLIPFKTELYAVQKYKPLVKQVEQMLSSSLNAIVSYISPAKIVAPRAAEAHASLQTSSIDEELTAAAHDIQKMNGELLSLAPRMLEPLKKDIKPLILPKRTATCKVAVHESGNIPIDGKRRILTGAIGLSANMIEAPIKNTIGIRSLSYVDISHHWSFTYGVEIDKYEFFTGLSLYHASYKPSISTGVFDSFRGDPIPLSEIDEISYSFISVPLGLRYFIHEKKSWSLYVVAAANINALAHAEYRLHELSEVEKKLARLDPAAINQSNLRAGLDSDVSLGLLQGGSLLNNISTSATIGLGLTTRLDERLSLFVQPSYTRSISIKGIGAQDEQIHSVKIDLGFRMVL